MDFFTQERPFTYNVLTKQLDLSRGTQQHLAKVYATLAGSVLLSAIGCAAHVLYGVGGGWSGFLAIGLMIWFNFTASHETNKRLGILGAFSVFEGLSIGPLVEYSLYLDPSIVVTAFLGATCIFACFTAAALFSKKRSLLYLGGILGSACMMLCLGSLLNMFFRSPLVYYAELYIGLLIFCGYVAFDTQVIVHCADQGDRDFTKHALELFLDFIQIFIRLLQILNDKESRKKRNED